MRRAVPSLGWVTLLAGLAVLVGGVAAVLAASIQGMALVPGGSLADGYDVGLLPWMDVGTWLVPIGGFLAVLGATVAIWASPCRWLVRLVTIPALLVVAFWILIVAIQMAPRTAVPDAPPSPSGLQTVVYSNPLDTIVFLLGPAFALVLLAAAGRRRPSSTPAGRGPGAVPSA